MMMIFKDDKIGSGEIGGILFGAALESILANMTQNRDDSSDKLTKIAFLNEAVLACVSDDSKLIDTLKGLERAGVEIICCKTCLNYFKIDTLKVGKEGNSLDIMRDMLVAKKVVTF